MNVELNEEQTILKDMVRSFIQKEFNEAHTGKLCEEKRYPQEFDRGIAQLGLFGICFPPQYEGSDLGALELAIVIEELSRYSIDLGISFGLSVLGGLTILKFGARSEAKALLPALVRGDVSFSCGYYEPFLFDAGEKNNANALLAAGELSVRGKTIYSEIRDAGKNYILLPLYKEGRPAILILPQKLLGEGKRVETLGRDMLGLIKYKVESLGGLTDAIVVEGDKIVESVTNGMKFVNLTSCIGNMETVIENTIRYSKERVQFDKPIGTFQSIQHMIVDAKMRVVSAKLYGDWLAWLIDGSDFKERGLTLTSEINMANTYITRSFNEVANTGLQVMGGYGYMQESHMERYLRDARLSSYYVEDAFWQKEVIAEGLGIVPQIEAL